MVEREAVLPGVSWLLHLGGIGLLSMVVLGLAIAATLPHATAIQADFVVRPRGEVRSIRAAIAGQISQLSAEENQTVTAGQVIAQLDSLALLGDRQQSETQIQAAQQQLRALAQARIELDRQYEAQLQVQAQRTALVQAKLAQSQQQQDVQQRLHQSNLQAATVQLELAQDEAKRYSTLVQMGVISQLQLKEKQQALQAAQAELAQAQILAEPPAAPQAVLQAELNQAKAEDEVQLASLRQAQQAIASQKSQVQAQLDSAQQTLQQLPAKQRQYQIQVPSAGTLFQLKLHGVGQIVTPGEEIAQVVPTTDWIAQAKIPGDAIGLLGQCGAGPRTGQDNRAHHGPPGGKVSEDAVCPPMQARLRLDAYPYPDYGTLPAQIGAISPDTVTAPDGSSTYQLTLVLEDNALQRQGQRYPLRVGMTGTAEILGPPETLLRYGLRKARLWMN